MDAKHPQAAMKTTMVVVNEADERLAKFIDCGPERTLRISNVSYFLRSLSNACPPCCRPVQTTFIDEKAKPFNNRAIPFAQTHPHTTWRPPHKLNKSPLNLDPCYIFQCIASRLSKPYCYRTCPDHPHRRHLIFLNVLYLPILNLTTTRFKIFM